MNNKRLILILAVGGFIGLGFIGGWWEFFLKGLPTASKSVQPSKPASIMYDSELTGWDDQKRAWKIEAVKIWESFDTNQIYFEKIKNGIIYPKKGEQIYFKAGGARWEKSRQELYISGNLEAAQDGEKFFTSEAIMRYNTEELFCPTTVEFHGKELQAKADRMNINYKKEELLLEGDVELIQKGDAIRAEGLLYWKKENKFELIKPKEAIIKP